MSQYAFINKDRIVVALVGPRPADARRVLIDLDGNNGPLGLGQKVEADPHAPGQFIRAGDFSTK